MVIQTNRLTGLVYVQGEVRILKRNVCGTKKRLRIWPANTSIWGSFWLKRAAVSYFRYTPIGKVVESKDVTVLHSEVLKGCSTCKFEHFVLYRAPASLRISPEQAEVLFEDQSLLHLTPARTKILGKVLLLACKELGLNEHRSLAA